MFGWPTLEGTAIARNTLNSIEDGMLKHFITSGNNNPRLIQRGRADCLCLSTGGSVLSPILTAPSTI